MNKGINQLSFCACMGLLLLLCACAPKKQAGETVSTTRYTSYKGELNISADAGLEPIMRQQLEVFEYLYDSVNVTIEYKSEPEVIADFKARKAKLLILSRSLSAQEIEALKINDTIYVRQQPVAYDAVALIAAPGFDDSGLDLNLLKRYFDPAMTAGKGPQLVFDNQSSGTVRYMLDTFGFKDKVSANMFGLKTTEEVITYVTQNKNAIGFIPFNAISDADDAQVKKKLEQIKILSLSIKTKEGKSLRVSANQSDIAAGDYPLIRTVNAVTHYTYSDNLELLMISFLTKEKGAKIFLKAGLIPFRIPEREINVNEGDLKSSN